MKYKVRVEISGVYEVEAETKEEARDKAVQIYF